ncbi:13327_t:CDS:2 [Acaulospora morrowiae]|uniref:13327_t:CDS:1 n=1 Tax=Acaulospora morrowiae TaxID=94023 RepID=A0A9N9AFB9_9GLOM|nr:13327_t:CDS:2 [Acaulospora morrowiae]
MVELLYETKEFAQRYRKTENKSLLYARGLTLLTLGILLCGYFAIAVIFLASDKGITKSQLQEAPHIPIPDLEFTFNYHFNITCTFRYLDGRESTPDACSSYITQPACNLSETDARWHGWFTATEGLVFNKTEKLNAVWYTIRIDDPRYIRGNDAGMLVRAYDSDFNPRTVPVSVNARAKEVDSEFFATLENLNLHVIGFQQVNWMFINRHIRRKMVPNFWAVLGAPPSYFDTSYITTKYESVTNPTTASAYANQSINGTQLYSNLYVGAMDWYQDVSTETRMRHITDSLALLSGFYGLLVGTYVLLFGFMPIVPWGFCQAFCMRRKVKRSLHKQYPKSIPLIETSGDDETINERINYLEQFLKQFVCDVDYMEDIREENKLNGMVDEVGGDATDEAEKS